MTRLHLEAEMQAQLPMLSTSSSIAQKSANAKIALTQKASPSFALKAAERLAGSWPHASPPNPTMWAAALGAVLAAYPPAIIEECCDPRIGLARKREFPPTVAAVVEWCDDRVEHYKRLASWINMPKEPERVFTDEQRAQARGWLAGLAAELKSNLVKRAVSREAAE